MAVSAVESDIALSRLRYELTNLHHEVRQRGQGLFKNGSVVDLEVDDHGEIVIGDIDDDGESADPELHWIGDGWRFECSCLAKDPCEHIHAAGLAWLDDCKRRKAAPGAKRPTAPAAPAPKRRKLTFREQWTPVLEEKLGRALTEDEGRRLEQLAELFREFQSSRNRLNSFALHQHGFGVSESSVDASYWDNPYNGWWSDDAPPQDPWQLWQYIAADWENKGRPLPEAFRPMTDTAAVHARLDEIFVERELEAWRGTLREIAQPPAVDEKPPEIADLRLVLAPGKGLVIETRTAPGKPWKAPTARWIDSLATASPVDFAGLPPAAAALAMTLAAESRRGSDRQLSAREPVPSAVIQRVLVYPAAHDAIFLPGDRPWRIESEPLVLQAVESRTRPNRLDLQLLTPDGRQVANAKPFAFIPEPLYDVDGRVFRGPPPPPTPQLPLAALGDARLLSRLRAIGLRLPDAIEGRIRRIVLRPVLRCWLELAKHPGDVDSFHAQLLAHSEDPPCAQHWTGSGWTWVKGEQPPASVSKKTILDVDLSAANGVGARFGDFKLHWFDWTESWRRETSKHFPEEFAAWRESLPAGVTVEAQGELAALAAPPLKARLDLRARPAIDNPRDWFDLTVQLTVEDTTLTPDEIALLLKARGKWVRLPGTGWRRLEVEAGGDAAGTLDRIGLHGSDTLATGRASRYRVHAFQLAAESDALAAHDAQLAEALRERAAVLATTPRPEPPAALQASLRPYQREGFQFLAHLSAHGFGGLLADDMGLGKTVQTLAWLLHLAEQNSCRQASVPAGLESSSRGNEAGEGRTTRASLITSGATDTFRPFRALVVCPKSVVHGWLAEAARFAPSLPAAAFTPALTDSAPLSLNAQLLVASYAQLRLNASWFQDSTWDAVVLDEAQFIKNPTSQVSGAARDLCSRHRLALTGTPVENRLLDLWSIVAFAQPGLLGTQASFTRQHPDDDPEALGRLRRRVRHFMLRRTKAQVATDLPPRTEDDVVVDLEGEQRRLYDAELKRARAQLLGINTDRALDAIRFNLLASLLRLRQICCHPALVDPAHRDLPSAKLDALLERLEELRDEGHQVLVFSQFTGMLELIREKLAAAGIGHLLLTGATENRAELVDTFQNDRTKTVFLLSLKAAGSGLNLTAASYAILYDPWWNPAVETQAIDRTHRIGQTRPVFAYRILASDTVEEKIRALQREKAALAGSIVQEETLAQVLDLESFKKILS
ncbi:MAG TPA: DEAD/DEAH box helicase [Opitutaceae bacterium]